MRRAQTLSDRIADVGGASSGFDYMRLLLAMAVLLWHSYVVRHGQGAGALYQGSGVGAVLRLILPMFFALSGFLVTASLERTRSLAVFLGFRALRIVPALAVEVTLSALLVGPLVTDRTLPSYFGDPSFINYFLNIAGIIHYVLPGVFTHNPWPEVVNGSLWTVPYELECYVALAVASTLTLMRRPLLMAVLAVLVSAAFFAFFRKTTLLDLAVDPVPGRMLVVCFITGAALQAARSIVPCSTPLAAACAAGAVVLLALPDTQFLAAVPTAYLTVWLGLRDPPRPSVLRGGDYSYGLYLYGFVVQQLVMNLIGDRIGSALALFAVALPASAIIAVLSWHVVERPALKLKRVLSRFDRRSPARA